MIHLNGEFMPIEQARISVLDRGFIFGDGVYEVIPSYSRRPFRLPEHLARMQASLDAIGIANPHPAAKWTELVTKIVAGNPWEDQSVYLQVTRGVAKRDHTFPKGLKPTVFLMASELVTPSAELMKTGAAAIVLPDFRWLRCDIKATGLLPAVLAKTEARQKGAYEAWYVDDEGFVTEGASTNAWIVTPENVLVTRALGTEILPGVTRAGVLHALANQGINAIEERAFTPAEAYGAREAFITSSGAGIVPVVKINGRQIGEGRPGPTTKRVQSLYRELWEQEA